MLNRTDAQQLVRDAAWRLSQPEKLARLSPLDFRALGMAIHGVLGWGVSASRKDKDAQKIRAVIATMDAPTPTEVTP